MKIKVEVVLSLLDAATVAGSFFVLHSNCWTIE